MSPSRQTPRLPTPRRPRFFLATAGMAEAHGTGLVVLHQPVDAFGMAMANEAAEVVRIEPGLVIDHYAAQREVVAEEGKRG